MQIEKEEKRSERTKISKALYFAVPPWSVGDKNNGFLMGTRVLEKTIVTIAANRWAEILFVGACNN